MGSLSNYPCLRGPYYRLRFRVGPDPGILERPEERSRLGQQMMAAIREDGGSQTEISWKLPESVREETFARLEKVYGRETGDRLRHRVKQLTREEPDYDVQATFRASSDAVNRIVAALANSGELRVLDVERLATFPFRTIDHRRRVEQSSVGILASRLPDTLLVRGRCIRGTIVAWQHADAMEVAEAAITMPLALTGGTVHAEYGLSNLPEALKGKAWSGFWQGLQLANGLVTDEGWNAPERGSSESWKGYCARTARFAIQQLTDLAELEEQVAPIIRRHLWYGLDFATEPEVQAPS